MEPEAAEPRAESAAKAAHRAAFKAALLQKEGDAAERAKAADAPRTQNTKLLTKAEFDEHVAICEAEAGDTSAEPVPKGDAARRSALARPQA